MLIVVLMAGFAAFWVWALFFASKEAVNRIHDRAWAERAAGVCADLDEQLVGLTDLRRVDEDDAALLAERAEIIDRATDIVEATLDEVVAVAPTDAAGREIVPQWEADYRTWLEDRRQYADVLRDGRDEAFRESAVDGIPISEKVATFAGDNEMADCSPPQDLAR